MKLGTIVRLKDGREATVVYNSLIGYGVRIGRIELTSEMIEAIYAGDGNTVKNGNPSGMLDIEPEALLRDPWGGEPMPCVGASYEVIEVGE
jgi:hypothetical protein